VFFEELAKEVGGDYAPFDLVEAAHAQGASEQSASRSA
jgi:hypothetical protein